ncbi:MAG: hypothetical protein K0S61_1891, partial [Anaerocolumna sp.]|nr:hypothetical protein [Anaerocolumna sp.]
MRNARKILSLLLVVVMCFGLWGCKSKDTTKEPEATQPVAEVTDEAEATPEVTEPLSAVP